MHGSESLEHNLFWKFQSERKAGETKHCFKKEGKFYFCFNSNRRECDRAKHSLKCKSWSHYSKGKRDENRSKGILYSVFLSFSPHCMFSFGNNAAFRFPYSSIFRRASPSQSDPVTVAEHSWSEPSWSIRAVHLHLLMNQKTVVSEGL